MNFVPDLAQVIGANVARRRAALGLSQKQLVERLRAAGGNWWVAAVSLLQLHGQRAERLSDIADLCHALDISLWDLLDGDPELIVATQSGGNRELGWLVAALEGPQGRRKPRSSSAHMEADENL